jgi:hypothetical protein
MKKTDADMFKKGMPEKMKGKQNEDKRMPMKNPRPGEKRGKSK